MAGHGRRIPLCCCSCPKTKGPFAGQGLDGGADGDGESDGGGQGFGGADGLGGSDAGGADGSARPDGSTATLGSAAVIGAAAALWLGSGVVDSDGPGEPGSLGDGLAGGHGSHDGVGAGLDGSPVGSANGAAEADGESLGTGAGGHGSYAALACDILAAATPASTISAPAVAATGIRTRDRNLPVGAFFSVPSIDPP
jgi:hypothetical protein